MDLLHAYLDAWRRGDVEAVTSTLADGCVVVDPQGSLLRGREQVGAWIRQWAADGGVVHGLQILDEAPPQDVVKADEPFADDGVLTARWVLDVTWQGVRATVEGRTMAHVRDGAISYLRDYTSAALGDWDGTWQP